jgi:hypothetical protein
VTARSPLRHTPFRRRPLGEGTDEVMRHLARLWGFTVRLERAGEDGKVELVHEIRGETTPPARDQLSAATDHPTARPPCSRLAALLHEPTWPGADAGAPQGAKAAVPRPTTPTARPPCSRLAALLQKTSPPKT